MVGREHLVPGTERRRLRMTTFMPKVALVTNTTSSAAKRPDTEANASRASRSKHLHSAAG